MANTSQKPLGAAFSRARATGKDQSQGAQRRRANAYLRAQGHAPMKAKVAKGILDRWRAMTTEERADEFNLRAMGVDAATARALAMTGNGKAPKRKPKFRNDQVDKMGPTLAEQAQNGHTSGMTGSSRLQRRKRRVSRLSDAMVKAAIAKGGPGSGPQTGSFGGSEPMPSGSHIAAAERHLQRSREARNAGDHANAAKHAARAHERLKQALGASSQRLQKAEVPIAKRHMVAQLADQMVQASYEVPRLSDTGPYTDPPEYAHYLDAQRLVAGMDQEIAQGSTTPTMARARASSALATNMGHYDRAMYGSDRAIQGVGGLNLDLGSGQARERGFLGLDLYPYDYGTVLHDVGLGIPFPDGSARAVRLVNALQDMPDHRKDATPLMREVQRVLAIGGQFYYVGPPLQGIVDWSKLPGLGVVSHQFTDGGTTLALTLRRQNAKLPLVYGADTNFLALDERQPADLAAAQATFGDLPAADVAMANLVHKREHVDVRARVLKKDTYQNIVLGAVLIPDLPDSQNDVMSAEDIQEAAHDFLAKARVVGKEHSDVWEGGEVVESYIAPVDMDFSDDMYGPQSIPKGTWVLGVRLPASDFKHVLDGSFTGFSVGGWGEREDVL